jgi:hypothetical protein
LSRHKVIATSAILASLLFLGSFLVLGKVFGRGLAEYQSRIVERFADPPTIPSEEQTESEISEGVNNIATVESESITLFSSLGIIVLVTIGLSFLLLGIVLIRFRKDIFEDFYTNQQ